MRIHLFLVTFFCSLAGMLAQNAVIKGTVKATQGERVSSLVVKLVNTDRVVETDSLGFYQFDQLPIGKYVVIVISESHEEVSQSVEVLHADDIVVADVQLKEAIHEIDEVILVNQSNRFANKESDYVARMPLRNLENPQVYTVITKELLKEQVVVDVKDALKNAPGAVPVWYPSGGIAVNSRGFLTGVNARNGMETSTGRSSTDFANLERIEVLKGPSGTLFGASVSSFGGVVNLVTKKPFETFKGEASYTVGSFGLNRITADVNTPLNKEKTALFRFNTALHRQGSFQNYGYNNSLMVAPSILFKATNRFTISMDAELYSVDQTRSTYTRVNPASGFDSADDIPLGYNKTLYGEDANALTASAKYFLEGRYKISNSWTSSTVFSYVNENVKRSYQYYPTWVSPTHVARNISLYGPINNNYTNFQQNFNGKFVTGFLKHNVLIGGGYRFFDGSFIYAGSTKFIDTIDISKPYNIVGKPQWDNHILTKGSVTPSITVDQHTFSAYVTDVINITPRLSTMLSLRIDRFKNRGVGNADYQQTSLAPKIGLLYQVLKDQLAVFGNYMSGFQNVAPITQPAPDNSQFIPNPIYAVQSEGGVKAEMFSKKLNLTVSYYDIAIDNAIRTNMAGVSIQDAQQKSKGVDVELIANPVKGLNIVAGCAYNDNRIVKSGEKDKVDGNKAANAPENIMNVWVSYKFQNTFLKNVGIGIGGNAVDKSYLNTANNYYMPAYKVLNATIFYEQLKWSIGLKVNNITSQKHWDAYGTPQALVNFAGNVTFKF